MWWPWLPVRRVAERALDHGAGERTAIGGAGVDVLLRVNRRRRDLCGACHRRFVNGAAVENSLYVRKPPRSVADADDSDMHVRRLAACVLIVEHGCSRHREIAAPARELLEAP